MRGPSHACAATPESVEQVALVPDQGAVKEFTAAALYPPFHDRVHPGHPDAAEHDLNSRVGEDSIEPAGELAVPVAIRNRARQPVSSTSMTRFLAA
jgi:hypothetical protein